MSFKILDCVIIQEFIVLLFIIVQVKLGEIQEEEINLGEELFIEIFCQDGVFCRFIFLVRMMFIESVNSFILIGEVFDGGIMENFS